MTEREKTFLKQYLRKEENKNKPVDTAEFLKVNDFMLAQFHGAEVFKALKNEGKTK